jgi:hypothetical protein
MFLAQVICSFQENMKDCSLFPGQAVWKQFLQEDKCEQRLRPAAEPWGCRTVHRTESCKCTCMKDMMVWFWLRASPAVLSVWFWKTKLDEEKSKHASFGWGKFVLAQHHCTILPWLVKGTITMCTCRKKCNKYDLTAAHCLWLAYHNDWSRLFAINSPPPIYCPSFGFMGGVEKH